VAKLKAHLQARRFGKPPLPGVKGKESLRAGFEGDGNVQQIHGALPVRARMLFAQLVRAAENVCPVDRKVHEHAFAQVCLDLPESHPPVCLRNISASGCVAQRVARFHSVQRGEE
jgi:hypothetical protein